MDSLQFQKVEFEDPRPKCAGCRNPMEGAYFQLAGRNICAGCAEKVRSSQGRPQGSDVLRGFFYGLAAAAVCAIGYGIIIWVTGAALALISIAIGYLVGRGVRIGSRGLGGRRCQILAVALAYFAITISYAPTLVRETRELAKKQAASQAAPQKTIRTVRPVSRPVALMMGVVVISAISLASPFLGLSGGFSGILGLIIVFVGLAQAWKQTARDPRLLLGPYPLTESLTAAPSQGPALG